MPPGSGLRAFLRTLSVVAVALAYYTGIALRRQKSLILVSVKRLVLQGV